MTASGRCEGSDPPTQGKKNQEFLSYMTIKDFKKYIFKQYFQNKNGFILSKLHPSRLDVSLYLLLLCKLVNLYIILNNTALPMASHKMMLQGELATR